MSVISFAVIGKSRIPLYLQEFDGTSALDSISNEDNVALFGLSKTASELPRDGGTSSKAMDSSKTNKNNMICSVQQQFILHDALDRLEQRVLVQQPPVEPVNPNANANDAMFLGFLCPVDDMRVYGYITTTQIVFLLVVEDDPMATTAQHQRRIDESIQKLFMQIHQFYVEYILNPFTPISVAGPIESPRFHRQVQDCVTSYNRSFL